ncbi:FAD-dependent oxidoreductase [Leucobacter sp. gxy201]|uniref:NAD(P)/FAD-dependent oxidoreductase n=1 Tax=Leucobacter sp. gxy201 TaxID=2957200 RepID=UPI003DA060A3
MNGMVIIGGGLAAETAAKELRTRGYDGAITVLASEAHSLYQRPPLSKGYLSGAEGIEAVVLHDHDWYTEHSITVLANTEATSLDTAAREVGFTDGGTLGYDKLLLATGASARRLPLAGADLAGVHALRTLEDADQLRAPLAEGGKRLVVIGSGWIGMEVAATARQLGNTVTVLERGAVPLASALGAEIGSEFRRLHEEHGVVFRSEVEVREIVGAEGAVTGVRISGSGAEADLVDADLVLIAVGAEPDTGLAERAGIEVDHGILTDASLRTSAPDVFAAGDVANPVHPVLGERLRSEHWQNAISSGEVAARSMLGIAAQHDSIPYFYTDQFDLGMELSGYPPLMAGADIVIRGDLQAREFIAFWMRGGRVVGGMNVNVWDVNETVQQLIREASPVDAAALADTATGLASLVG